MRRTQLLLVDDHILFRDGVARLLAAENDLEVSGVCGTTAEALDLLSRQPVDVVLLDFDLGEEHGTQFIATARVRGYEGKVLMVTAGMSVVRQSCKNKKMTSTTRHMVMNSVLTTSRTDSSTKVVASKAMS